MEIKITIEVGGEDVTRTYKGDAEELDWATIVADMIHTLAGLKEEKF